MTRRLALSSRRRSTSAIATLLVLLALAASACAGGGAPGAPDPSGPYDVVLRGGMVVDGTGGRAPYRADVAITGDRIAAIGELPRGAAAREIVDVNGLYVAPGFINLHSHARPDALPTAENMLTQGVTTEILNADGGGPLDVGAQLRELEAGGLAVNVGANIGFNSAWTRVVGQEDRRPTIADIDAMRAIIQRGLEAGAWGVSAGLDYKPAYFATADEVVRVVDVARPWETVFTNHDRITPEAGYSSMAGMRETIEIAERAGLTPLVTHMKIQGHEQGTAPAVLAMFDRAIADGTWTAADVYPYLAGQTSLAALIIPGWAQEGGREAMLARFQDPALRARIIREADEAMAARLGGPSGVYLPATHRELTDIMREMGVTSGGEAVVRIIETEARTPSSILRFGLEDDLRAILRYPTVSVSCDCGASTATVGHPRGWGTFPRVLGRYVREEGVLTWEQAIHKMSGLPARTIGMEDRGLLERGMFADVAVFDPETIIDHATYAEPTLRSDGMVHVLVNGRFALRDGRGTGERAGRGVRR